jgi:hypothetical protein
MDVMAMTSATDKTGTLSGGRDRRSFLLQRAQPAMLLALAVTAFELLTLAWIRRRFFGTGFLSSLVSVTLGGVIIAVVSAALGAAR